MPNIEEIKSALIVIKNVCSSHSRSCISCPLCYNNTCGITGNAIYGNVDYSKQPKNWGIVSDIKLMREVK